MTESVMAVVGVFLLVVAGFWLHPSAGLAVLGVVLLVSGLFFDFGSER